MITGGCACGQVRYAIDLARLDDIAICHCSMCRRSTGGTHVTWATVPRAAFTWTAGEPSIYASSEHAVRHFCSRCGAQLAFVSGREPRHMDVTVATLDEASAWAPDRHIWTSGKLPWVRVDDGLAQEPRETPRGP
jgi:hypothetical protein